MASEQFSLCWDNFHKNMSSGMNSMLENEDLVDVTLAVEGKTLKAHKMVLSVCSPYFKELFKSNPCKHPIVFMKDVSYVALSDLLQFMYQGEVQVSQENLTTFIKTAEALQIKGLTGDGNGSTDVETDITQDEKLPQIEEYKQAAKHRKTQPPMPVLTTPTTKRRRVSGSSDSQPPPIITKPEPVSTVPTNSSDQTVQFKMEPYDHSQTMTLSEENVDESFGEETLDDTNIDDSEDYSLMEGADEPQAGTSGDGAGEGQDDRKGRIFLGKFTAGGYTFSTSYIRGDPPKRYLRCCYAKKFGCKARGVVGLHSKSEEAVFFSDHNHPADYNETKTNDFFKELKRTCLSGIDLPLRRIYDQIAEIYPEGAKLKSYESVRPSMWRWKERAK